VFNALYSTQDNVLVASPTGSGKTICAEFAILKLFADVPKNAKAVYITPYPTLAKQVSSILAYHVYQGSSISCIERDCERGLKQFPLVLKDHMHCTHVLFMYGLLSLCPEHAPCIGIKLEI